MLLDFRYNHGQVFQPGLACLIKPRDANVTAVKELWDQAMLPCNLPLTILLGLVVVFWVFTLLGAIGMDSLDIDVGADVDLDVDADADVDVDGGVEGIGDIPAALLRLVNAGSVPVTVVLSILVLAMWTVSITLNYYFNPTRGVLLSAGFFFAALIVGVIATKIITQPLVPFMRRLKAAENAAPVIGEVGVVRSIEIDSKFGQVEVARPDGAPALLNARLGPDAEPASRGSTVAIISLDEATGVYLVRVLPDSPPIE